MLLKDKQLIDTINEDCIKWQKLNNKDKMLCDYMYLNIFKDSSVSGLYQLMLNEKELWYGTLSEINAIIKSMIVILDKDYLN